jgi:transcriptional regulator with XRE-family HTH domain
MLDEIPITAHQSRGARAMLGWSREQLAERSRVSAATLADFEAEKRTPYNRTLADIRSALEAAGVEFISEDGDGGPGVRLRKGLANTAAAPASASKRPPRTREAPRKSSRLKRR